MSTVYKAQKKGYIIANSERSFNRALYGKYYEKRQLRFKAFAGDRPGVICYTCMDMGRLFWGAVRGDERKLLQDFETVVSTYEGGVVTHFLRDKILQDGFLEIRIVPGKTNHGVLVKITAMGVPKDVSLVSFYGFCSGKTSERGMDAGYIAMSILGASSGEIGYLAEKCSGNYFQIGENGFLLEWDTGNWRKVYGSFSGKGEEEGICDARLIEAGTFDLERKSEEFPLYYYVASLAEKKELYCMIACPDGEEMSADNLEGQFKEAIKHYETLSKRVEVNTPENRIDAGMYAANLAVEGFWLDPVFNHGAWAWDVPILGWRSMYGPSLMGMHREIRREAWIFNGLQFNENMEVADKETLKWVEQAEFANSLAYFRHQSDAMDISMEERTNAPLPDSKWEFARQSAYGIINSEGRIPFMPDALNIPMYDMQEVYFDQLLYEWENTGDAGFAKQIVEALKRHGEWEKRCFDPDDDGLYENYANFWATDGLFASGGAGSVATAYNYRLHTLLGEMCEQLHMDGSSHMALAEKIKNAFFREMWSEKLGRMAENYDAMGERMKHYDISTPSIMHCAESGILDEFQLYQTLQFASNELEHTKVDGGEVVWFTNWAPYVWSVRDAGFADTFHLALAYFQIGQREEGYKLLLGAVSEPTCNQVCPGGFSQVLEGKGIDFADTSSMYVRTVVEGLYGVRCKLQRNEIYVEPHFPGDWTEARLEAENVSYSYHHERFCQNGGGCERMKISCIREVKLFVTLSMKYGEVRRVLANGKEKEYILQPAIGHVNLQIELEKCKTVELVVEYDGSERKEKSVDFYGENGETITVPCKKVLKMFDPQKVVEAQKYTENGCALTLGDMVKHHTVFLEIADREARYYLPVNIHNKKPDEKLLSVERPEKPCGEQKQIPMAEYFNDYLADIYRHEYLSPRPSSCSLQVPLHLVPADWCNVDASEVNGMEDELLREKAENGIFCTEDGLRFLQPANGKNICYISKWDNYPSSVEFPVEQKGEQLYVLFTGYTNQMQCGVINAIFEVIYEDGSVEGYELTAPKNFRSMHKGKGTERTEDRWCYGEKEPVRILIGHRRKEQDAASGEDTGLYAQIGTIALKEKKVKTFRVSARANEIIVGIMGITVA